MATRKNTAQQQARNDVPEHALDTMFFGLAKNMNDEQKHYVEAMWNGAKKGRIVFVQGRSGTGKTTLAILTAVLALQSGLASKAYYIRAMGVGGEKKIGFLPGMIEKVKGYFTPAEQALIAGGLEPHKFLAYDMTEDIAQDLPIICSGDGYLRGVNLGSNDPASKAIVLIDEAQNLTIDGLRMILTRVFDNSLVVVMGHTDQIDLDNKAASGFVPYIRHFSQRPDIADFVTLNTSMRGKIASWADEIQK